MDLNFHELELPQRRRMLADAGFVRDTLRVWAHPDGRAVGEGVASALTDAAFCRYLGVVLPVETTETQAELLRA